MAIRTSMSGSEIDRALRAILDVTADEDADGNLLYIRGGELSYEDGDTLFDVTELEEVTT